MSNFDKILTLIYEKSPLQKKRLLKYLATKDIKFFFESEKIATDYLEYLKQEDISLECAVSAYLTLCDNMIICQKKFLRTGYYPIASSNIALDLVYNNRKSMVSYMTGLAISQLLWATHYKMFTFFINYFEKQCENINSYLEIGPGHGLFLLKSIENLNDDKTIRVVDISQTSIDMTKSLLNHFYPNRMNIEYYTSDILNFNSDEKFDFITMGEVLEHVNFPEKLLKKLFVLMKNDGRSFISTCVNCPAIDHVYYFKSISEIQNLIHLCNFEIEQELILPVEDVSIDEALEQKITVNYCAILKKEVII